jgi:hypothetical protein
MHIDTNLRVCSMSQNKFHGPHYNESSVIGMVLKYFAQSFFVIFHFYKRNTVIKINKNRSLWNIVEPYTRYCSVVALAGPLQKATLKCIAQNSRISSGIMLI